MRIEFEQVGDAATVKGTAPSGFELMYSASINDTDKKMAASPMESLLGAVVGCASVDVIMILNKMKQEFTSYKVIVDGERVEIGSAKPFRSIDLEFLFTGDLDQNKVNRACKLSVEKYCSVLGSMHPDCKVSWKATIQ